MYKHGDVISMTKEELIKSYKAGDVDMDDSGLVVHYGGLDEDELDDLTEQEWRKAIETALEAWADLCCNDGDGQIYTGSL